MDLHHLLLAGLPAHSALPPQADMGRAIVEALTCRVERTQASECQPFLASSLALRLWVSTRVRASAPQALPVPLDKITQTTIDPRPPCPVGGFPAPEHFEASAMPSYDGLRLNHLGHPQQARPEPNNLNGSDLAIGSDMCARTSHSEARSVKGTVEAPAPASSLFSADSLLDAAR